jgi:hypothetical protein
MSMTIAVRLLAEAAVGGIDPATYQWIIGILVTLLILSIPAAFKYRADAQGWKVSYEREREATERERKANERAERRLDNAELASDIGSNVAEGLRQIVEQTLRSKSR